MKIENKEISEACELFKILGGGACRNGQWYIVEKEYYCDGYRISALCEYNAVKLYEDLNKG